MWKEGLFKTDTGAKCNTLTPDRYQLLMHEGEMKHSNTVLHPYSNHMLKPVAVVDLLIKYKKCEVSSEFEIVDIARKMCSVVLQWSLWT